MTEQNVAEVVALFDKCPYCGAKERMMETLGNELKEKGLIGEDRTVSLSEIGGPIFDPAKLGKLLVGSTVPAMYAAQDICLGCGRMHTVRIVKRQVPTTAVIAPGQAQSPGVS